MVVDIVMLTIELETNPIFNTDVVGGHNGILLKILNMEDVTLPKRWRPVDGDDFLDAIALENLTPTQEARIQTYTQDNRQVPLHKENVRAWVFNQNFSVQTISNIERVGQVMGKPSDVFLEDEDNALNINDIRVAITQISKSYINQPTLIRDASVSVSQGIEPTDPTQVNSRDAIIDGVWVKDGGIR